MIVSERPAFAQPSRLPRGSSWPSWSALISGLDAHRGPVVAGAAAHRLARCGSGLIGTLQFGAHPALLGRHRRGRGPAAQAARCWWRPSSRWPALALVARRRWCASEQRALLARGRRWRCWPAWPRPFDCAGPPVADGRDGRQGRPGQRASALNSAAFNAARIVGPAIGGLLIARVGVVPGLRPQRGRGSSWWWPSRS